MSKSYGKLGQRVLGRKNGKPEPTAESVWMEREGVIQIQFVCPRTKELNWGNVKDLAWSSDTISIAPGESLRACATPAVYDSLKRQAMAVMRRVGYEGENPAPLIRNASYYFQQ